MTRANAGAMGGAGALGGAGAMGSAGALGGAGAGTSASANAGAGGAGAGEDRSTGPGAGDAPARHEHLLYCDGASRGNPGRASIGFVLEDPNGAEILARGEILGDDITNNVAEYTALLRGLEAAVEQGVRRLCARLDSELVVRQVRGEYRVRHPALQPLHAAVLARAREFERFRIEHVPRRDNKRADALANAALDALDSP